ncbi:MAG: LysR family transcriptional regulator [Burkholderiales bacterium]|nr:LysR family transcriptional regulator [Burkholderiales bacterium]
MLDQRIRYFLTIAETGSLSEAAERLGLSQSGLSRQLKLLEDHLGRPLFARTGRGVVLNDIGKRLDAAARPAFEAIDATLEMLRTEFGVVQGSLRIAMVHTLSLYFLPPLLAQFHASHPGINTYLLGRGSPEVVNLVGTGKVDLGFVYDVAVTIDGLDVERLFEERMCLVHHRDTAVDVPTDAGPPWSAPLITFPKYYALRQMLHRAQLDRHVVAEVETVDTMLRLVSCKLGVCVLPDLIPDSEFEHLQLERTPISLPDLRRWVVGIRRRDAKPALAGAHLMALAKAWRTTRATP